MALFKVFKGNAANLMANKPNAVDGYCYFTIDDGKFYIDVATAAQAQIGTNRIPINAKFSDVAKTGLMLPYTVCNSAGSLISKEITIATEGWELQVGSMIAVYFANANAVANPTLCINGGDPVPIYKVFGKKAGGDIANSWDAGSIVIFFYTEGSNGTNQGWVMANWHDPQQTIDAAIAALDVAATTLTQAQTIKSISETDGKIVVTKQAIKITKSQISDFPTTMPNPNKFTVNTLSGTTTNKITDYDGSAAAQINFKTGSTNGTFAIDDGASTSKEVAIKGLNTAAYQPTTAFATAAQGTKADNAMPKAGGEFTGNVTFASGKTLTLSGDPINDAEAATKQYVDNKVSQGFAANDAMVFKGIIPSDTVWQGILGQNYSAGWTYRVGGSSGFVLKDTSNNAKFYVEPGDLVICVVDKGASASADNWIVVQANLDGAVTSGLTSVTTGALAVFSGTSGKIITKAGAKGSASLPVYVDSNGVLQTITSYEGTANKARSLLNKLSVNGKEYDGSAEILVGTIGLGYGGTGATTAGGAFLNIVTPGGIINGDFVISNTDRDTASNTKGLYIRRGGTATDEQARISFANNGLWFDLNNDSVSNGVYFNLSATDTETASHAGAGAFTNKQVSITAIQEDGTTVSIISADRFDGTADKAKKLLNKLSINGKEYDGHEEIAVGTIGISYGGTGATTAANARYNLIGSSNIGSASVPVYWNKTDKQFKPITSYSGTAAAAQKLVTVSGSTTTDVAVGGTATPVYFENGVPKQITSYGGNAATATQLSTSGGTGKFWRGDNSWSDTLVGPLYINNSTDAAGTNATGALIIGNKTGANIAIDDNEVMARNNSATATLYLNNDGGLVQVGAGGLTSTGTITGNNLKATTATKQTSPTKIATLDANNVINHVIPSDLVNTLDNANHKWVRLAGDTMTGRLKLLASQYDDSITSATAAALDLQNSNIIGVNAIYTADAADGAAEGINFYRDATHFDTLWISGGDILFAPNRALGTNTTKANSQKVARFTANPTSGQIVVTDGTTGGVKAVDAGTALGSLDYSSPATNGSTIEFIDTIKQENGLISATKKTVQNASDTVRGVVSLDAQTFKGAKTFLDTLTANASGASVANIKYYTHTAYAGKTYINWIQLASFDMNTSNQLGNQIFDIILSRTYNSPSSEVATIRISIGWDTCNLVQLSGSAGSRIITKFRVVKDNTAHKVYFEYYVDPSYTTYQNTVNVRIIRYTGSDLTLLTAVEGQADTAFNKIWSIDLANGIVNNGSIKGTIFTTTDAAAQTTPTKVATINSDNQINYVTPANLITTLDNTTHKWVRVAGDTMTGRLTAAKGFNNLLTGGTGTVARDAGASASPRYFPAQWKFNAGVTVADGDIFTIKIPCAGHSYGVFLSVNNGTNFYPVAANGTGRITTHYPANTYITVVFESSGSAASMTPLAGADAANGSTISGGVFRVINYYDANTTYSAMSVAEMKTGTATTSRVMRADYLKTFLSTLGGTSLTLTHDATNGLILNHDNSGVTANTYGNTSQQTPGYGATFNIPYFTVNAQGHITAASTTTVKLPAEAHYTTHLYAGSGTAANAATTNGNTKLTVTDNSTVRNSVTIKGTGSTSVTSDANGVVSVYSKTLTMSVTNEVLSFSFA